MKRLEVIRSHRITVRAEVFLQHRTFLALKRAGIPFTRYPRFREVQS